MASKPARGPAAHVLLLLPTPCLQVHAASLSSALLEYLEAQPGGWGHGPHVVLKVQHCDVQRLMSSDLGNMGRVARFLRGILPFDVMPVSAWWSACLNVHAAGC